MLPRGVKWFKNEGGNLFIGVSDVRVGLPRGVKLCKSEGVICPEGGKMSQVLSCKGGENGERVGAIFSQGVKWCKSWAATGGKMV